MVRCQDDYEAGRKIGQREHRHEGAAPGVTGAQLRERRAALGLSQAQLATALGTTENTIARWERSALTIAQPVLLDLALEALERRKGEA
jgi:DNA-binding transcriptional regulator YiaG